MSIVLLLLLPVIGFLVISVMSGRRQSEPVQVIEGVLEVFGVNVGLIMLVFLLASIWNTVANTILWGLMGLSLLQLIYVVPRSLSLKRQQRWARLKGVITGAVIVALLNGGCWLFLKPW
jgi:cell division protein FtsW (lipid II flippase)